MSRSLTLLLIAVLAFPALSQNHKAKSPELFSVGGIRVNADEFLYLYTKNHTDKSKDYTKEKVEEYLQLFINFKLKVAEAKSRGIDTTAAFSIEYNSYRSELRKPYLPDAKIIDSLVALTYHRMKDEVRAAHILITLKPDAAPADTLAAFNKIVDLRKRILAGEDFGALAAQFSEDPSAKVNHGDLGYFTAMQMVFPFETAAYTTPVGQLSSPVKTRFGYHLVKVLDKRPSRGEVEVSHIMIRTGEGANADDARNRIFEVFDQARAGMSWNDLCQQYSEDVNSKNTGGKIRPFGVGVMNSVPEFERVAFALQKPGDISDPFQTAYSWHIVRLERKIPLGKLQDIEPSLKNRVSRDERVQLSKEHTAQKLRKEFGFTENAAIKTLLSKHADSTLVAGKWAIQLTEKEEKATLFGLSKNKYTAGDFVSYVKRNARTSAGTPSQYFETLYNNFVDHSITGLLEQKIATQNPTYRMLLNEYYEGILLFDIMEKEVWNKASIDSIGQHEFYSKHAQDYVAGERAQAELYVSHSAAARTALKAALSASADTAVSAAIAKHNIRFEKGLYEKKDRPVFSLISWSPGVYEAEKDGIYYLAKISEILPPGPKKFEEARAGVIADYQNELERIWLEKLRKKYPVKVNEKGKAYIFETLKI